jgi:hypothetical protein
VGFGVSGLFVLAEGGEDEVGQVSFEDAQGRCLGVAVIASAPLEEFSGGLVDAALSYGYPV